MGLGLYRMRVQLHWQPRFYRLRRWGFMHVRKQYSIRHNREGMAIFLGPLWFWIGL